MSYEIYLFVHLVSVVSLFLAVGGLLSSAGLSSAGQKKRGLMVLHGLAVLFLLITGFGLMARLHLFTFPLWTILKLVIWALLGIVLPILIAKKVVKNRWLWLLVWLCGLSAVWLAVYHSLLDSSAI